MPHEYSTPTYKIHFDYGDFTALANAEIVEVFTIPMNKMEVYGWYIDVTEAFTAGGLTEADFAIGTTQIPYVNEIMARSDLMTTGYKSGFGTIWTALTPYRIILDKDEIIYGRVRANMQVNSFLSGAFDVHLLMIQH